MTGPPSQGAGTNAGELPAQGLNPSGLLPAQGFPSGLSDPVDDSVTVSTAINGPLARSRDRVRSNSRQLVRLSNGNLVFWMSVEAAAVDTKRSFISQDGGATWNFADLSEHGFGSDASPALGVDGSDVLHAVWNPGGSGSTWLYRRYTQQGDGTATIQVDSETIVDPGSEATGSDVSMDANGIPFAIVGNATQNKGSSAWQLRVADRRGGAWTIHGPFTSLNNTDLKPSCAFDTNGVLHLAWERAAAGSFTGDVVYATFDPSDNSFTATEQVVANTRYEGSLLVQGGTPTLVDGAGVAHQRSGGNWSTDQFTTDNVERAALTSNGSELIVVYIDGDTNELKAVKGAFGGLSGEGAVVVEDASVATWTALTAAWQQHHFNTPGTVDYIMNDGQNDPSTGNYDGFAT